jgi:CBS domain-containing protein
LPALDGEALVGILTSTDVLEHFLDVALGAKGVGTD